MTSVNSPACLLARNRFYRNSPSGPDQLGPDFSSRHNQKPVALCVTMATPPGGFRHKGLWVHVVLGSSSPRLHISISKPGRSAGRADK